MKSQVSTDFYAGEPLPHASVLREIQLLLERHRVVVGQGGGTGVDAGKSAFSRRKLRKLDVLPELGDVEERIRWKQSWLSRTGAAPADGTLPMSSGQRVAEMLRSREAFAVSGYQ